MRRTLLALAALATPAASFASDRVVFLVGESEYGSDETMPAFATELEGLGLDVEVLRSRGRELPDLGALDDADLIVLFLRFRDVEVGQLERLRRWFDEGRPAVALRTTSHAFRSEKGWFPPLFGGHYKTHADNSAGTLAVVSLDAADHPILRGVPRVTEMGHGGTYDTQPLSDGATALMFGRTGDLPSQPIAWTFLDRGPRHRPESRIFYTSLGSRENFERPAFRTLLANAVLWGLGREVPTEGAFGNGAAAPGAAIDHVPAPPPLDAPEDATVLFDGNELDAWRHWDPSVPPRAIRIDERADTSSGGLEYDRPRWTVEGRALVARPGFGDLVTREAYGDYHLHLDFLAPPEPAWVPDDFRGASGVYLSGRYEVQLLDSHEKDTTPFSSGAIHGLYAPAVNASLPAGVWQSLDVTYTHRSGEAPRVSVWLNDVRVQDDVAIEDHTVYGFLEPVPGAALRGDARFATGVEEGEGYDFGRESFAVSARFRTRGSGTLVSKCPPAGKWVPDAKALFLRGGRLVYDIGWVGALSSRRRWNDGEWHTVVLTSDDGRARLYVDGELEAERADFRADDEPGFVLKVGDANDDFGGTYEGEIAEARFYGRSLSRAQAEALSGGEDPALAPEFAWSPRPGGPGDATPLPGPDEPLCGPIRLQADCSPVRFANVWVRPLGETDHAGIVATLGPESYARGEEIYMGLCVKCHGEDGMRTVNPKARPFAISPLVNGADPYALFNTLTYGYQDMPIQDWLRPDLRYDVIHYVREKFLREQNPTQYFEVTDAYLNSIPKGRVRRPDPSESDLSPRDWGPALASELGPEVGTALTVRLDDDATIAYDLQVMESPGAWTGGFLDLSKTQHYQQRGEGLPSPDGEPLRGLEAWGWGHGGTLDWDRSRRPERGPLPDEWLDYRGHYVHGDRIVLSYAIDGRDVLEVPAVDRSSGLPVITHRLWIAPGETELVLATCATPDGGEPAQLFSEDGEGWTLAVAGRGQGPDELARFAAVAVLGDGTRTELRDDGRTALVIPASQEERELWILRAAGTSMSELAGLRTLLDNIGERRWPASPTELVHGGPPRWAEELVTEGELGGDGAYVLDTVALPEPNPWNAWVRTSAVDFFPDGRAAVSTYGGDVWIVSGLDDDLDEVRWRRFAAGMYEPMGVRVVDELVYVTCRDRIVRLHDLNSDGEADRYESFFADPDVSATFHAFNFDLQTDAEGNFYYAKSGQYTDYALPGAILKIAPDGSSYEVYCTGLRTPNGMGMSPDGRPLVSDNQGNWIPASKVSLAKPGGFYGVFKSINTNGPGQKTRDDFDPPVLWMPQSFDSSSGGQLWVDDERWGPLSGRYLHTSFGKGWMYVLMVEDFGHVAQAGAYRFPFQFAAGIQRLRVNPADGQVWAVGLSGWQGPPGGDDGCLQRVRYTGEPGAVLLATRVRSNGVELEFSEALGASAAEVDRYGAKRWNYEWARSYGSAHYSVERPGEEGEDDVPIRGAKLSEDGKKVFVELDDMRPVHQLRLRFDIESREGERLEQEVYLTVNHVPDA